ncbi:hypothetical protein ACVIQT_006212 [Bradyrhizobium diazoefficiens]
MATATCASSASVGMTLHEMGGRRRLSNTGAALCAGVARSHRLDHTILGGHDIETAGAILADLDHPAAAAGTLEVLGFDHLLDARQVRGKGTGSAPGPAAGRRRAGAARTIVLAFLDFGDGNLDVLENQLHLIGIELFRAFTETCALVLLHEQFEAFDALFGRSQFTLDMKARRAFIVCATTLGFNHRFLRAEERAQIGGQRCKTGGIKGGRRHIRKLSSQSPARNRLSGLSQFAAAGVATIRSPTRFLNCTRVRCMTPSLICGHSKRPSRPRRL